VLLATVTCWVEVQCKRIAAQEEQVKNANKMQKNAKRCKNCSSILTDVYMFPLVERTGDVSNGVMVRFGCGKGP
jgi:hypothetical protein